MKPEWYLALRWKSWCCHLFLFFLLLWISSSPEYFKTLWLCIWATRSAGGRLKHPGQWWGKRSWQQMPNGEDRNWSYATIGKFFLLSIEFFCWLGKEKVKGMIVVARIEGFWFFRNPQIQIRTNGTTDNMKWPELLEAELCFAWGRGLIHLLAQLIHSNIDPPKNYKHCATFCCHSGQNHRRSERLF